MKARIFILILVLASSCFAVSGCPVSGDCPDCKKLDKALQSIVFVSVDSIKHEAKATFFYENISASPSRQPISNSPIIVQVYNSSFNETFRVYTDAKGIALFDFSSFENTSINMRFLYCPFMNPIEGEDGYSKCGFLQCLDYGGIKCKVSPSCLPDAIPEKLNGGSAPSPIQYYNLLPSIQTSVYNPPSKSLSNVPAICLPSLIIFSLLGGALFLSGRNPFAGFDFSAPRVGRHIRYQARTISAGVSAPTPLVEAVKSSVQGAVISGLGALAGAMAGGGKKGEGVKEAISNLENKSQGGGLVMGARGVPVAVSKGGGRRSFGSNLKAQFKGGSVGWFWDQFRPGISAIKEVAGGHQDARSSYNAMKEIGQGSKISFTNLKNLFLALGSNNKAVAELIKAGGSNFSADIKNIREVKDPQGNVTGIQLLDGKGKPVKFTIGSQNAEVVLDPNALREGKISGKVTIGDRTFSLSEGNIVGVFEKGKALEGKALESAIKGFDMKSFSSQLSNADIKMETRMFSEQFGGAVTVKYNPLSVGSTGDFDIIKPGSSGDANGVTIKVANGTLASFTDNATGKAASQDRVVDLGLSGIKVGQNLVSPGLSPGEGIGILRDAYKAHEAVNNITEAMSSVAKASTSIAGEAYVTRNKSHYDPVEQHFKLADIKVDALNMSGSASDYAKNAPHIEIIGQAKGTAEQLGRLASGAVLSNNPEFQRAQKQYNAAIAADPGQTPKMSADDARKKYLDPVITKLKDASEKAYSAAYQNAFKVVISASYVEYAEQQAKDSGENLSQKIRTELKNRANDIAEQFKDDYQTLKNNPLAKTLEKLSSTQFAQLYDSETKTVNMETVHEACGQKVVSAAQEYKNNRKNPEGYSARELAFGALSFGSPDFKVSATSVKVNSEALQNSSPTKGFKTFIENVDILPGDRQEKILRMFVYNPSQAAEEAAKEAHSGKSSDIPDDRGSENASIKMAEEKIRQQKEEAAEEARRLQEAKDNAADMSDAARKKKHVPPST